MNLLLKRFQFTDISTIGKLYVDGNFICYTLEDKDRGLNQNMSLLEIKAKKIFGITAIPYDDYKVKLTMSNRFGRLMPEVLNVKGYSGIRIHRGNTAADSLGCPIVGFKFDKNTVYESTAAEAALMRLLNEAKGEINLSIDK